MIANLDITGVRYTPDESIKRYVRKKIGALDRYLSRHARKSVTVEIKLRQVDRANGNKYECDVIMYLPEQTLTAHDSTLNMFAAIDIVEEKMRTQLKKYHDAHTDHKSKHNLLGRLKRRSPQLSLES